MIQEEDDEGLPTACVCGYIYCWDCKQGGQDCDCGHVEFYDQLTDTLLAVEDARRFPVAGPEHFEDSLADFMEERRQAIYRFQDGEEEDEEDDEEEVEEEPVEADLKPLFWDCNMDTQ